MDKSLDKMLICQLYTLSPKEDDWTYVNIGYANLSSKSELVIIQRDSSEEVHKHAVAAENQYQITDEAIQFTVDQTDFAISFQQKKGAQTIWDGIQKIISEHKQDDQIGEEDFKLTPVNALTLPRIVETMSQLVNGGTSTKQQLSYYLINKKGYLDCLMDLFNEMEAEQNLQGLQLMCSLVKIIVAVAEHELYQIILSDQYYLWVFGALEYDEEMQKKEFIPHRRFLRNNSNFVQVVTIKSKEKQRTIQFIYRLSYLRDCSLAYYLDEMQLILIKLVLTLQRTAMGT